MVPGAPFEIGAPPFHVSPPGCYILHTSLQFKNMAPLLVFAPPASKSWRRDWTMGVARIYAGDPLGDFPGAAKKIFQGPQKWRNFILPTQN